MPSRERARRVVRDHSGGRVPAVIVGHLSTPWCRCYEAKARTDHPRPARRVSGRRRRCLTRALPAPAVRRARDPSPASSAPSRPLAARPAALDGHALRARRGRRCGSRWSREAGRRASPAACSPSAARGARPARLRDGGARGGAGAAAVAGRRRQGRGRGLRLRGDLSPSPADGAARRRSAGARFAEALDEVMGHFGRRAAEEMPAAPARHRHPRARRAPAGRRARDPGALGAGLGAADVEPIEREFSYARYFGMEEHRLRHRRFDGGMSEALDRAVFTSGDAVTVLPFDPRAGTRAPDRAVPRRAATRGATRIPGASRRWPGAAT